MKKWEKVAVILAGLFFLASVFWALLSPAWKDSGSPVTAEPDPSRFTVESVEMDSVYSQTEWKPPEPQGGANWIFDIFTPPVIYYDAATETFTVTPPFPDAEPKETIFELELVDVRQVPFRFQLVSYAGKRGNYLLTLENLETGRDVFCAPGETLLGQEITIVGFSENRIVAGPARPGSTEAFDLVGHADVLDLRTGQRLTLRHDQTSYTEDPVALFRTPQGEQIELEEGDSWSGEFGEYLLQAIDFSTKSVTLEKTSTDVGDKDVKILQFQNSFNSSDLSNRNSRQSDPSPGTF